MRSDGGEWRRGQVRWLLLALLAAGALAAALELSRPRARPLRRVRPPSTPAARPSPAAVPTPAPAPGPTSAPTPAVDPAAAPSPELDLFAGTRVHELALDIDETAMESLRQSPREWASATLRFGAEVFPNVAVHIKGSQGSLQPIDLRPSLTVSFNRLVPGRKFHGLKKIHFNNTAEDPTFMNEVITSELCRASGLPAARAGYALLTLNGRRLGLYVLKEGLTKEFLARHFRDAGGALYDGGFQRDINQPWEEIGGEGPADQADRLALLGAAREPDLAQRWKRLREVLDTDRFITLLAWTTITWNWDGYPMSYNNYRIYHDPETDRLVFFPHGLDQMFWKTEGPIHPRFRGLLAAAMMQIPEVRRAYLDRLTALATSVFDPERLGRRVDELAASIEPHRPDARSQAARLKHQIAARARSIADQLGRTDVRPASAAGGAAALSGSNLPAEEPDELIHELRIEGELRFEPNERLQRVQRARRGRAEE